MFGHTIIPRGQAAMSTRIHRYGHSGRNHQKPFVAAFIICAIIGFIALVLSGTPQ
jgi:hypothetical protein